MVMMNRMNARIKNKPQPDSRHCEYCMLTKTCHQQPEPDHCKHPSNPIKQQSQHVKRNESLYTECDTFKCVYAVSSGAMKTFHIDLNGQEHVRNFYLPGEIIGLEGIQPGYYPYSATAIQDSVVCEIPFEELLTFIAEEPALQREFISTLGQRINQGNYLNTTTAEQRVAAFIIDLITRLNCNNTQLEVELPMSRSDIGSYLGLAHETVSRIFTRFQKANYIAVKSKMISILNIEQLRQITQIANCN